MRSLAAAVAVVICCGGSAAARPDQHAFQGRRLDDALRILQQRGLPIVFSSEIVTPDMRVIAEPRATSARQQLDELLEPHGLAAERGPAAVILVVRHRPAPTSRPAKKMAASTNQGDAAASAVASAAREIGAYTERVTVTGSRAERIDRGASEMTFDASGLRAGRSVLQDDGLQAVHGMPGVAAVDDFRSEFSVRGSPYRHVGVVIDGVATPWLQHTVYGRSDAGSLSMFGSGILERATLRAGAYPRRYDDTLGAEVELTLREGSRESTRFGGSAGGMSTAFAGEGPIGADARGSWIVSVRNSYRPWPVKRLTRNDVAFAFADAHAKLVYDVTPTQQFSATALGGRSTLDTVDEPIVSQLGAGTNHAALFTVGWRSTLSAHTVIRQRLSFVGQELLNTWPTGQPADQRSNRALAYRGEALHALFGGTIEAGGEVRQLSGTRYGGPDDPTLLRDRFGAGWSTRSAYANFARTVARGVSFAAGLRASESTLAGERALAPWLLAEWRVKPGWTVNASAGASRQFPDLDAVRGLTGSSDLAPERATHVDVGIEQRRANGVRWQATLFTRVERDVLRAPDLQPRLMQGVLSDPSSPGRYRDSLRGTSRGLELLVARESAARVSGWIAYAYGGTRQTDSVTQETFWGDFDRRHAFNAAGVFRIADETSAGIVFRGASGVPITGYLAEREGGLFAGERRNTIRLPFYARLDARVQRTFVPARRRVTVFAEILNVMNRQNLATADGFIQPLTGEAAGFSRPLMPRRASVGIAVDWGTVRMER
jgi:hypothetical protein